MNVKNQHLFMQQWLGLILYCKSVGLTTAVLAVSQLIVIANCQIFPSKLNISQTKPNLAILHSPGNHPYHKDCFTHDKSHQLDFIIILFFTYFGHLWVFVQCVCVRARAYAKCNVLVVGMMIALHHGSHVILCAVYSSYTFYTSNC